MRTLIIDQAIAALSASTASSVLLVTLGARFEDMDGRQVRDLADLRPIIGQEAFEDLSNRGQVVVTSDGGDAQQIAWSAEALGSTIKSCSAPLTALLFESGEMTRIASNLNYSPPSGIKVAKGARG